MTPEEIRQLSVGVSRDAPYYHPENRLEINLREKALTIAREHCAQAARANELKEMELRGEVPVGEGRLEGIRYRLNWRDPQEPHVGIDGLQAYTYFIDGDAARARLLAHMAVRRLRANGATDVTLAKHVTWVSDEAVPEAL